jgi:S-adenosylmethionine hydrolase
VTAEPGDDGGRRPVVTLTTDFGLRDPYVAAMKGAILDIAPAVDLVDITHEVERHDIAEGALALEAAAPFFPRGTIHVAVVDPGVGTARRGIVLEARGHVFVGPDNGLFTPFVDADGWHAFELHAPEFRLPVVSRTFHGRDVFAPAAAHVARGVPPARFGPPVADPVLLPWLEVRAVAGDIAGTVVHVDRFGNLITSIHAEAVESLGPDVTVQVAGRTVSVVGTYGELSVGVAGALLGSSNRLEIAVREGSAADALHAHRGTPVLVTRRKAWTASKRPRRT